MRVCCGRAQILRAFRNCRASCKGYYIIIIKGIKGCYLLRINRQIYIYTYIFYIANLRQKEEADTVNAF